MSTVRVIARIRPLLAKESESEIIVKMKEDGPAITIPNPKNEKENFTFPFAAVLDSETTQAQIFSEVSPTIKHLFKGNDATVFAYGVTGTGKTFTMRGGKSVTERGVIPRLLSAIYKRGKELEKKSEGQITVTVDMTYYEIYNDKVFDLFEPPEKRSLAGLPLREHDKKTIVVGLTEKRVSSLKEFEALYDTANANRTTFATKLNASSSRSHAITGVRVTIENQTTGEARMGTLSAIDLAGSEDNRRTCNDKERMTESASINKSLFVLAQCVEAISKKQARIPYRESKMTRILSLGQNNGMCIMILNIAPTKAYHLDTLSSLNFANRAKKIEVKEVENPVVRINQKIADPDSSSELMRRPALRPVSNSHNTSALSLKTKQGSFISTGEKPSTKPSQATGQRPAKLNALRQKHSNTAPQTKAEIGPSDIDKLVERKVEEILAARAGGSKNVSVVNNNSSDAMIKRVEQLERQLNEQSKAVTAAKKPKKEKLTTTTNFTTDDSSYSSLSGGLKMYEIDLPDAPPLVHIPSKRKKAVIPKEKKEKEDDSLHLPDADLSLTSLSSISTKPTAQKRKKAFMVFQGDDEDTLVVAGGATPRTARLLAIINSEDVHQIKSLRGVGPKRAEFLAGYVRDRKAANGVVEGVLKLEDLAALPGIGKKIVEAMRVGVGEQAALPVKSGAKKVCKEGMLGGGVGGKEDLLGGGLSLGEGNGLLGVVGMGEDDQEREFVRTPGRRRSRTVMSRGEVVRAAMRDYVDHLDMAFT
ncbi:kinesin family protein [Tirmania nivea]|nr:kinesin family protein [Tirmania nivea]